MGAYVRDHNGTPTLFLDDGLRSEVVPSFGAYIWSHAPLPKRCPAAECAKHFAEAGIHLHDFDLGSRGPVAEWCGPTSPGDSHFDFSTVKARLGRVLEVGPDARFHLRVHLETVDWWETMYLEESPRSWPR